MGIGGSRRVQSGIYIFSKKKKKKKQEKKGKNPQTITITDNWKSNFPIWTKKYCQSKSKVARTTKHLSTSLRQTTVSWVIINEFFKTCCCGSLKPGAAED